MKCKLKLLCKKRIWITVNYNNHIFLEKYMLNFVFFSPTKKCEEDTMKRLDDLKNEAYKMEVKFLESKLESVKKRIK